MIFYNDICKMFRIYAKMTLEDVAKAIGVSKPTVQRWEAGKITPKSAHIFDLAKLFRCSVSEISDLKPEKEFLEELEKNCWDEATIRADERKNERKRLQDYIMSDDRIPPDVARLIYNFLNQKNEKEENKK